MLHAARVTAFVSPRRWPANGGNVIVVPNAHVEDLESCDVDLLGEVYAAAREIAIAMRSAYGCGGTSTRQHNGEAAGQEIPHLHVHVFPRYADDRLYARAADHHFAPPAERRDYAQRLRARLGARL